MTRTSVSSSSRPCAVCAGPGAGSGKRARPRWSEPAVLGALVHRHIDRHPQQVRGLSTGPSSSLPSSRSQVSCKASLAMSAQPSRRVRRAEIVVALQHEIAQYGQAGRHHGSGSGAQRMTQARSWSADCGTISITKGCARPSGGAQGDAVQRLRDRLVAIRVAAGIQQMGVPHPSLLRHAKAHRRPETATASAAGAERIAHAGSGRSSCDRTTRWDCRRATARPARAAAPRRSSRCTRRPGQNLRSACAKAASGVWIPFTAAERRPTVNAARYTTDPPVTLLYCSSAPAAAGRECRRRNGPRLGRRPRRCAASNRPPATAAARPRAARARVQRAFERQKTPTPHARGALPQDAPRACRASARPCRVRRAGRTRWRSVNRQCNGV